YAEPACASRLARHRDLRALFMRGVMRRQQAGCRGDVMADAFGAMQFGIFDQNDHGPYPLHEQYENRLRLVAFYDRAGFRTYHMSEHHSTPLNLTPSPSVFLAAVAQRTKRLRLGALRSEERRVGKERRCR